MGAVIFILGTVMALFAVLGYLYGSAAAFLVLAMVVVGLLIIANAGGRIITLINAIYRFVLAGGVQALSSGGDLAALKTRMAAVAPLIPNDATGAVLLLILIILILLAVLAGRHPRFRRPSSGVGLLVGLASGYLVGAYLLAQVIPALVVSLPLPFGLGSKVAAATPAAAAAAASGGNFGAQLMQAVAGSNPTSLGLIVSILVATIIFVALLFNLRGRGGGRGRRDSARD